MRNWVDIERSILLCVTGLFYALDLSYTSRATVHLKPPQSHRLFSRLAFDEDEYLLSQLEEDDSTSQCDPDDEHIKREAEPDDGIADGGWLEGDDIEDF